MGQHLAKVLYVCVLGGCSLIYNPSNLPDKGSMPPDAAIADADPSMLRIDDVKSPELLEGAGQSGSAPQVLVVYGGHITPTASITLAPATANPAVDVKLTNISIAEDGNSFAGTVTAAYMDMLDETGPNASPPIPLTITITQDGAPAPVTKEWLLKPLDEHTTSGMQPAPEAGKLFSRIDVTGDMSFTAGGPRVVLRAVGGIKITGVVRANAAGQVGGAGGCAGGAAQLPGECFGGGLGDGGGGGFADRGEDGGASSGGAISGDPLLRTYNGEGMEMNRGGGGGGGVGSLGGGGGGAIEITAGGTLEVGSLEARAGAGTTSTVLGLGRGGGGGAGGSVVLRAGAMLTMPTAVAVAAGAGGAGVLGGGGAGSIGRWRYDANATMNAPPTTPAPKRGPILVRPTNPIFEAREQTFMVTGDPAGSGAAVGIVVQYADGSTETKTVNLSGATSTVTPPDLRIGLNVVCVVIAGGNFANDEAKNCIEVAFVP